MGTKVRGSGGAAPACVLIALFLAAFLRPSRAAEQSRSVVPDSTGRLFVAVCDSASGGALGFANAIILHTRLGGMTDKRGRITIGAVPTGVRVVKTVALAYHDRVDTVLVRSGRLDSLKVRMTKWRHIRVNGGVISVSD